MLEYAVGPVVALLVAMKFTDFKTKKQEATCSTCCEKIELLDKKVAALDQETVKKMLVTITPVAKAVQELQEYVGVK